MTFGSCFAGIGGIDRGLERAGMTCRWQIENDPFCLKVLAKHWPLVKRYGDIAKVEGEEIERVDCIAGGFPCQDISIGGRRAGLAGERSGLFYELAGIVRVLRPRFILLENVSALLDNGMGEVLGTLAALGYDAEWDCLPAVAFGAPHQRDRVFIVAYSGSERLARPVLEGGICCLACEASAVFGNRSIACGDWWRKNSSRLRVDYGIPRRVAKHWLRGYGNAVVPQVAEWIGRRITEGAA